MLFLTSQWTCIYPVRPSGLRVLVLSGIPSICAGALKATNNRGLQPAMDHLIENEGNPVPDLSSVSSAAASTRPAGGGDPMDEDDDLEALRAVYGPGAGGSDSAQVGGEAKVRSRLI